MEQTNTKSIDFGLLSKPSLSLRIKSTMIDTFILILLMLVVSYFLNLINIESGLVRGIAFFLVWLYEPIFIVFGGTLGQRVMGLELSNFSTFKSSGNRKTINFFFSFIRFLSKLTLGWISLLTIHSDHYGQAIHDKIGKSVMLKRVYN